MNRETPPTTRPGRRTAAPLAALLVPLLLGPGTPARAQLPAHAEVGRLANGLTVLVDPGGTTPMATIEVVVRGGASTQVEEADEGLPHILEHMLFKAYGRNGFGAAAADLGATYNGTTDHEAVTYYVTLPSERLEDGMEAMAELLREPDFRREEIEAERQVVRGELERRASDPYALLDIATDVAFWGPGYRQRNAIGYVSTILGADRDRLRTFYERYYRPGHAALVVTGDVDPARVLELAEERFGEWEAGEPAALPDEPAVPSLVGDTAFLVVQDVADVTIMMRWLGPSVGEDPGGADAAQVLATMVGLPTSGTQERLVHTGIFETAALRYQRGRRAGTFTLVGRLTPENLERGLLALGQELTLLARAWTVSEEEFAAALKRERLGAARAREASAGRAHALARAWARGEEDRPPPTREAVTALADRYIDGQPVAIGILISPEAGQAQIDGLRRALFALESR